ncbi:MAG: hypothetical protein R3Y63_14865 [Eubacteriales bacterium]
MDSILEETIHYFMENHHTKATQDPRTEEAVKKLCEVEERLIESFSEEQKELFVVYQKAISQVQWLQQEDLKKLSFVFAMKLRDDVDEIYEKIKGELS